MFKCKYCAKSLKTKSGIQKHELYCEYNPEHTKHIKRDFQKNMLKNLAEDIRQEATSPEHLIQLIEVKMLELGVKVTFVSYPSRFSVKVSNSHSAPRGYKQNWCGRETDKGVPTSYPGWAGNWKGSIKVVDKSILGLDEISLDNFVHQSARLPMRFDFWYLKLGSGCPGKDFSISGILWLYDFPKMYQEFKDSGGDFNILQSDYIETLNAYKDKYQKDRNIYINSRSDILTIRKYLSELDSLKSDFKKLEDKKINFHKENYNKKYGLNVPLPNTAFSNIGDVISQVHGDISYSAQNINPDMEALYNRMTDLTEKINTYIESHAEDFI